MGADSDCEYNLNSEFLAEKGKKRLFPFCMLHHSYSYCLSYRKISSSIVIYKVKVEIITASF